MQVTTVLCFLFVNYLKEAIYIFTVFPWFLKNIKALITELLLNKCISQPFSTFIPSVIYFRWKTCLISTICLLPWLHEVCGITAISYKYKKVIYHIYVYTHTHFGKMKWLMKLIITRQRLLFSGTNLLNTKNF